MLGGSFGRLLPDRQRAFCAILAIGTRDPIGTLRSFLPAGALGAAALRGQGRAFDLKVGCSMPAFGAIGTGHRFAVFGALRAFSALDPLRPRRRRSSVVIGLG